MGEGILTVYRAQMTSQFPTTTGMTAAVVSFTYRTPAMPGTKAIKTKMSLVKSLSLTLLTDVGKRVEPALTLPADIYRMHLLEGYASAQAGERTTPGEQYDMVSAALGMRGDVEKSALGIPPDDFVAIFVIPEGWKTLTLHIHNPAVKEGQPRLAAVSV